MRRKKKQTMPGSQEALEEIRRAKFQLDTSCRLMRTFVVEGESLIKQCELYKSTFNFKTQIMQTEKYISLATRDIIQAANAVKTSLKLFNTKNMSEGC